MLGYTGGVAINYYYPYPAVLHVQKNAVIPKQIVIWTSVESTSMFLFCLRFRNTISVQGRFKCELLRALAGLEEYESSIILHPANLNLFMQVDFLFTMGGF